jgi:predicted amidophosphoribosyltransferase
MEPHCGAHLQGKNIILVDDVMTSGATMAAASVVLQRAGAQHITALVFARTARGDAGA